MHKLFGEKSPFHNASPQAIDFITCNASYKTFLKNECLYHSHEVVDGYFGILEGKIRLCNLDEKRERSTLWDYYDGDWIGYVHHFANAPSPYDACALEKVKVIHISAGLSDKLLAEFPELYPKLISDISARYVRFANQHICTVAKPLIGRVCYQILRLSSIGRQDVLSLSQKELASLIGASREAVSAKLKELSELGAIEVCYRKIILKDKAILCSVMNAD